MQKVFEVTRLNDKKRGEDSQFIAFREGDRIVWLNLEIIPEAKMKFDKETGDFSITFNMQDGQYLSVGNGDGFSSSGEVKDE